MKGTARARKLGIAVSTTRARTYNNQRGMVTDRVVYALLEL